MPELLTVTHKTFAQAGYVVLRDVLSADQCDEIWDFVAASLDPLVGPAEFEADVGYPGSPADRQAPGGTTPRRLLHAYARSSLLRRLACHEVVGSALKQIIANDVRLSQCHHNCVMTKHPGYSSNTLWHQDIRYWSFDRPELVSAWFALRLENRANGALEVIPGSHRIDMDRGRFDRDLFLRSEIPENQELLRQAITVELNAGDVLLFHCRLFHAAGKNRTDRVKLSPVCTYHSGDNLPIPGTRSSQYPSVNIDRHLT
jgi:phytanoyl-CoA hydroxylase